MTKHVWIKLAKDLIFDLASNEILSDGFRCQIIGESGSGKSSAAALIIVQGIGAGVQAVVLDAHGEYAPLAAASSNVILVGYQSTKSEPLYCSEGAIESYLRAISQGKTIFFNLAEWVDLDQESLDKFALGLLAGLYTLRRRNPRLTLLLGEEIQNLAPLMPLGNESKKIRVFTGIMTGGRKFGIQPIVCSQAPALVNARVRGACNVRLYLRISDWKDWKNGVKDYIPDDLGVVYKIPKRVPKDVDLASLSAISKFPPGYAIVLSRWHPHQLLQLDRPSIAPNKVIPSVLT